MKSDHPGADLLAELTQRPQEALAGNYSAMGRALREHLGALGRAALDSVSGDPGRMAAAQARMAEWNETLKSHGVGETAGEGIRDDADAPGGPRAAGGSGAGETESDPSGDHPGAAPGQPEARARAPDVASQLRAMADAMRRRADALAAAREAARGAQGAGAPEVSNDPDSGPRNPTADDPGRP